MICIQDQRQVECGDGLVCTVTGEDRVHDRALRLIQHDDALSVRLLHQFVVKCACDVGM